MKLSSVNLEKLDNRTLNELIINKVDFSVKTENFIRDVDLIEYLIEINGFTCRVYTENRVAGIGAAIFSGIGTLIGTATAVGIAIHNIATYNPDFEIGRDFINSRINVSYKK
ncbi:hypothetical protein [Gallibacterium anatis]|uniref:Uncharacterized protein n=1 Tax=Gallibacterium anatis TaxID=750 RepID=A0A1A7P9X4_9PAST|nr:hypothetical protein [Gallibacterium anatis]OBW95183.1 hypothetical protein QV02_05985 [Gallibacterium anatis]OBW98610.1 hypothetical protein QV03_06130 [Gallibacterium anatis]UZD16818.1 hypothetical protein OLL86_04625 [Gallibacterium anatis]